MWQSAIRASDLVNKSNIQCTSIENVNDDVLPHWAPITAVATNFVVNELLGTYDVLNMMKFVDFVKKWFEPIIQYSTKILNISRSSVHFIFKGGNVMRFILH